MKHKALILLSLSLLAAGAGLRDARAHTSNRSVLTYQGVLKREGVPANGPVVTLSVGEGLMLTSLGNELQLVAPHPCSDYPDIATGDVVVSRWVATVRTSEVIY